MKEFFIKHFRYYLISVLLMTVFVIFMKVTNMELSIGAIEIGIIVGSIGLTTKLQKEGNLESIKDYIFPLSMIIICNVPVLIYFFIK